MREGAAWSEGGGGPGFPKWSATQMDREQGSRLGASLWLAGKRSRIVLLNYCISCLRLVKRSRIVLLNYLISCLQVPLTAHRRAVVLTENKTDKTYIYTHSGERVVAH